MVQNNINKVATLISNAKKHCMCLNFEETKDHFIMLFPDGFAVQGVRVSKDMGKIKALEILLEKAEFYWSKDLKDLGFVV